MCLMWYVRIATLCKFDMLLCAVRKIAYIGNWIGYVALRACRGCIILYCIFECHASTSILYLSHNRNFFLKAIFLIQYTVCTRKWKIFTNTMRMNNKGKFTLNEVEENELREKNVP